MPLEVKSLAEWERDGIGPTCLSGRDPRPHNEEGHNRRYGGGRFPRRCRTQTSR